MTTSSGKDFSLGLEWSASMMANAARDPYWQGSVRRETIDHPESKAQIEDECSICHMPIPRYEAKLQGKPGEVFAHIPFDPQKKNNAAAEDGVTCSVCHQIGPQGLGTPASYVGNFVIDPPLARNNHPEYGPYAIEPGQMHVMTTSTGGFDPTHSSHILDSALCGSCHTLITKALGEGGKELATFYEQMPYPEWLHSDYADKQSCQSCHMPEIHEASPISSVLGVQRTGVRRHTFVGGNFLLIGMLDRYRDELNVTALPQEMSNAVRDSKEFLQTQSARVTVSDVELDGATLNASVLVQNLAGHKLPTAYPSRRAWLHFVVHDSTGQVVFESGKLRPDGSIVSNDNDDNPLRFEPHYSKISRGDQVEIYESIMKDQAGHPTTGLLHAIGYLKDNRVLPTGFDKRTAPSDIAVVGAAADDAGFHRRRRSCAVLRLGGQRPRSVSSRSRAVVPAGRLPLGTQPAFLQRHGTAAVCALLRLDGPGQCGAAGPRRGEPVINQGPGAHLNESTPPRLAARFCRRTTPWGCIAAES